MTGHNDKVVPALDRVDQLAFDLMSSFNSAHEAGFGLDQQNGRSFFAPPGDVTGAASRVTLEPGLTASQIAAAADPTLVPGDNSNLALFADILGGGPTVPDENSVLRIWQTISGDISQSLSEARSSATLEGDSRDQLSNLLASKHGVSIEEEMLRMSQAQTALEASNTVIREAQKMTDTILAMVN
jgi:flagellar hook-associated protein 1 FlgK